MDDPEELRARATHYRELAAQITDARARTSIIELARQYEQQAEMEADPQSHVQPRLAGGDGRES